MSSKVLNLAIVAAALLLVSGLVLKLQDKPARGGSAALQATREHTAASAAKGKTTRSASGAKIVLQGSLASSGEKTPAPIKPPSTPLSTQPPSKLALTDVKNYKSENGMTVLVLRDGSELPVSAYVYKQLPESIRFRINYEREGEQ